MSSLLTALLPAAATALAVTTLSTAVLPSTRSPDPARVPALVAAPAVAPLAGPAAAGAPTAVGPRPAGPVPPARQAAPRSRWEWPIEPRPAVARSFVRPASTWGAGHRGVDLASATGSSVLAVDGGVIGHVGVIAGRSTVTVVHRSGLRSTYEPVDAVVTVGDEVGQGQQIGTLAAGGHCPPATCLHLGALRADAYLDPLTLFGAARVRLLPLR